LRHPVLLLEDGRQDLLFSLAQREDRLVGGGLLGHYTQQAWGMRH